MYLWLMPAFPGLWTLSTGSRAMALSRAGAVVVDPDLTEHHADQKGKGKSNFLRVPKV
jgi:hypothetical protein